MPRKLCQLIQALVIERSHELCIDRTAFGILHHERPLLLLTRGETIAEGGPLQLKLLLGQGPFDLCLMGIAMSLLHPSEGVQQAVAIFLFIGGLDIQQLMALIDEALLDDLFSSKDTIYDMHILGRRTHLDGDGRAVVRELCGRLPEPVVCLNNWHLVVEGEHHELTMDGVALTDGVERMLT